MKRSTSFIIIFIIYIIAFFGGLLSFRILEFEDFTLKIIIADIVATIIVWLFGWIFKNSSVYDPYWSVAPLVIVPLFIVRIDLKSILMLIAILLWGLRLTINWAYTFKGLKHQDWRYTYYKNKFPKLWQVVNFFGINMMPTVVVISVMLPSFIYLKSNDTINFYTILAFLVCLLSILLELVSDYQAHVFRKHSPSMVNNKGLWKYSRHPNYLGEILMWWGVFLMMLSISVENYIYFIGPLLNTLMFIFISIPLMEKRQLERKSEYSNYINTTSMLILLPPKNRQDVSLVENV